MNIINEIVNAARNHQKIKNAKNANAWFRWSDDHSMANYLKKTVICETEKELNLSDASGLLDTSGRRCILFPKVARKERTSWKYLECLHVLVRPTTY